MSNYEKFRQFISSFLHNNPNAEALMQTLAEQSDKLDNLTIAVTDQLSISTARSNYLDKRLSETGLTRPSDLGVADEAFSKLGIQLNATKQINEAIHAILETFYGEESVRARVRSGNAEPFFFEPGDDLVMTLEDGTPFTLTVATEDFDNIQQATAKEVADFITRNIRARGLNGYAQVEVDVDTGNRYVMILGGAKGPYSFVQILGGRMQNEMEFPSIRGTDLPLDDTVWEITRTTGQTHRFRWVSGSKPLLENVIRGDKVLIYGAQFETVGISGTFDVTGVSPAQPAPSLSFGWFEITIDNFSALRTTPPGVTPSPNSPPVYYAFTAAQSSFNDLKFFLPKKNAPYNQTRYALSWEAASGTLKVYVPATTKVVRRDLIGSAHIHMLYPSTFFDGAYGSSSVQEDRIQILNDRAVRFRKGGYDNIGSGGVLSYLNPALVEKDINYVFSENGYTTVVTVEPHGITGLAPDSAGNVYSNQIINVQVDLVPQDDPANSFLGAYVIDPQAGYTLTDTIVKLRQRVYAGESRNTVLVSGRLPNESGYLWFDLNKDTEEGPVRYFAAQYAGTSFSVNMTSISQNGTTVTVNTQDSHGLVPNQQIVIAGTINFNGTWAVLNVADHNTFTFVRTPSAIVAETTGTVSQNVPEGMSTVVLDSSYMFKSNHELQADATLISDVKAYEPTPDGTDYGFYLTSTAEGRVYAVDIINKITALGINFEIVVIYPGSEGLGNGLEPDDSGKTNDKTYVWGA